MISDLDYELLYSDSVFQTVYDRLVFQVAGGGTTSTSTNLDMSRDDEGLKSALSLDQESEVCRHRASPELPTSSAVPFKSAGKRMSLGSNIADLPPTRHRAPLRSAHSVQVRRQKRVFILEVVLKRSNRGVVYYSVTIHRSREFESATPRYGIHLRRRWLKQRPRYSRTSVDTERGSSSSERTLFK